jgi:hypothetical protein
MFSSTILKGFDRHQLQSHVQSFRSHVIKEIVAFPELPDVPLCITIRNLPKSCSENDPVSLHFIIQMKDGENIVVEFHAMMMSYGIESSEQSNTN